MNELYWIVIGKFDMYYRGRATRLLTFEFKEQFKNRFQNHTSLTLTIL